MKKYGLIILKALGVSLAVVFLTLGVFFVLGFFTYQSLKPNLIQASVQVGKVSSSLQSQDLIAAKEATDKLRLEVTAIQKGFNRISFLAKVPFIGSYVSDGQNVLVAAQAGSDAVDKLIVAIEPYSDLLGFKADAKKLIEVKSIEDRIVFLVNTLGKISPELDKISGNLETAKVALNKINPNRYPENIMGKNIRSKVLDIQQSVNDSSNIVSQAKPLISLLPTLLGDPDSKMYMLLLQNDGEIRPTGGFMSAYAFIKVTKGKIEPLSSFNIYDLDAKFTKRLPAPDPIKKYLNESVWYIRNQNLSPDFKVSMDTFASSLKTIPSFPRVDGIIALDTYLPVKFLDILGPIGVGGWGNFSSKLDSRCNCPQVVYALEDIISKPVGTNRTDRKAVLGPLMHSILANAMGSPKSKWPQFLNAGLDAINQKHVMFYFFDDKNQKTAEGFNAAGRIKEYQGDYLHINDSNFGGAKSDFFITRDVEQEIQTGPDKITKKVTITYTNPHKGSNCNLEAGQLCLNGVYRDWVRVYVPKGSKLISVIGSELKESVGEDLGKTVFEGFFTMRPESSSKLVFNYELPMAKNSPYKLLIQKQPGFISIKHSIIINGRPSTLDLTTDKELTLE